MDAATSLAACICVLSARFGALCWARANYNMGKSARDRAGLRREDAAKTCDYCHRQLYSKWSVGVAVIAPRKQVHIECYWLHERKKDACGQLYTLWSDFQRPVFDAVGRRKWLLSIPPVWRAGKFRSSPVFPAPKIEEDSSR